METPSRRGRPRSLGGVKVLDIVLGAEDYARAQRLARHYGLSLSATVRLGLRLLAGEQGGEALVAARAPERGEEGGEGR